MLTRLIGPGGPTVKAKQQIIRDWINSLPKQSEDAPASKKTAQSLTARSTGHEGFIEGRIWTPEVFKERSKKLYGQSVRCASSIIL